MAILDYVQFYFHLRNHQNWSFIFTLHVRLFETRFREILLICLLYTLRWYTVADYLILSDISISDIRPQIRNSRPRILISGQGFEPGFENWSAFPGPRILVSAIRLKVPSNLVLKLTRWKKSSAINIHWQIATPSCWLFDF